MKITLNLYPNGKTKALTTSFDDGTLQDRRLVPILDSYKIKGTFYLNSGLFGTHDTLIDEGKTVDHSHVNASEVADLYKNHEVGVHTLTHPFLDELTVTQITNEVQGDKKNLEELVFYPVRGIAYPYGAYDQTVIDTVKKIGLDYGRTIASNGKFTLPVNYYQIKPTCVLEDDIMDHAKNFIEKTTAGSMPLFNVWGHSYAFDMYNLWGRLDEFCKYISNRTNVWYATNGEVIDYLKAIRSLKFSVTGSSVYNPSGTKVWFTADTQVVSVLPGQTLKL